LRGKGLRPRVLTNAEGDSIDEGQGLLSVRRSAAHSNTQEKRDKSRDSLLGHRENTEGRGQKRDRRDRRQKT